MTAAADRDDYVAFFEEDRTFHLELVRLSGYEHLVAIVEQLRDRTLRYGIEDAIADTGKVRRLLDEHRQLLQHLNERDSNAAAALLHNHILGSRARDFASGAESQG
jgi:DNA-binding GntR family transcriptional regulator